jgi:hypothetical protein
MVEPADMEVGESEHLTFSVAAQVGRAADETGNRDASRDFKRGDKQARN